MFISVHYFILAFLVLVGIVDLAKILIDKIIVPSFPRNEKQVYILIKGHIENLEYITRNIIYNYENNFSSYRINIIFLNFGIDKETEKICNLLLNDYDCIKILNIKSKSRRLG